MTHLHSYINLSRSLYNVDDISNFAKMMYDITLHTNIVDSYLTF